MQNRLAGTCSSPLHYTILSSTDLFGHGSWLTPIWKYHKLKGGESTYLAINQHRSSHSFLLNSRPALSVCISPYVCTFKYMCVCKTCVYMYPCRIRAINPVGRCIANLNSLMHLLMIALSNIFSENVYTPCFYLRPFATTFSRILSRSNRYSIGPQSSSSFFRRGTYTSFLR